MCAHGCKVKSPYFGQFFISDNALLLAVRYTVQVKIKFPFRIRRTLVVLSVT